MLRTIYYLICSRIFLRGDCSEEKFKVQQCCIRTNLFALFAYLISRTFSANEQYFSLITNQPTVLSAMPYQSNEQGTTMGILNKHFKYFYYSCFISISYIYFYGLFWPVAAVRESQPKSPHPSRRNAFALSVKNRSAYDFSNHLPSMKVYIIPFEKMHLTHREDRYLTLWGVYDHALKISVGDQLKPSNTHLSCHKRSSLSCGGMDGWIGHVGEWTACQNSGAMRVCANTLAGTGEIPANARAYRPRYCAVPASTRFCRSHSGAVVRPIG